MEYEDRATENVERQTAKVPSLAFLGLAVGAMAASAALVLTGRKQLHDVEHEREAEQPPGREEVGHGTRVRRRAHPGRN